MPSPLQWLQTYWGYTAFRPLQEDIITHAAAGHDSLVILPTGGGKSICYQIPALMRGQVCVVITPLVALMEDQCNRLNEKGLRATALHQGLSQQAIDTLCQEISHKRWQFVFIAPERLQHQRFLEYLNEWPVGLFAIDEAHCISQWGHDFRPAYRQLITLRNMHPRVPIMALTATATPQVQADIVEQLNMPQAKRFTATFVRENLGLHVVHVPHKRPRLLEIIQKLPGACMVYCRSRQRTVEIASWLNDENIKADYYHAGLTPEVRSAKQAAWMKDEIRVMVCTNAFGMGIDKPNVQAVIHYDMPDSPEAYYQEAGRAGRNGNKAYAIALWQEHDKAQLENSILDQYPAIDTIKQVYEYLGAYLKIPIGEGEGAHFPIDMRGFSASTKLPLRRVLSACRILAANGYISLSESVYQPAQLMVLVSREEVEVLRLYDQDTYDVLQAVLRTYGGVWLGPVPIDEFELAQALPAARDFVTHQLQQLHHRGIIQYQTASQTPHLYWLHPRQPTKALWLNETYLHRLREACRERVETMLHYLYQHEHCRMALLVHYFGEEKTTPCGMCDVCRAKRKAVHAAPGNRLRQQIIELLRSKKVNTVPELLNTFSFQEGDAVYQELRILIDEEVINLHPNGILELHS